ncbi:hypothetical protein AUG19_01085 [archaeon 13_1_20CM_2_54_9]|nr:MAG: hypothetical protein AUG19_01085 [archaeon 13_1_20CM_2_54_9]
MQDNVPFTTAVATLGLNLEKTGILVSRVKTIDGRASAGSTSPSKRNVRLSFLPVPEDRVEL